jgi:hypothetical protein
MSGEGPERPNAGPDAPHVTAAPDAPQVGFEVLGCAHEPFAAQPTMRFELGVSEPSGRDIYAITVSAQIMLEPARREYEAQTRAELKELFGAPERWPSTTRPFLWQHVSTTVHSFAGTTTFGLGVPCTADLEVPASRYVEALPDGDVPLNFLFTGRVLYAAEGGRVQAVHLPWDTAAKYRMPVASWGAMMKHHHGQSAFINLHKDTLASLARHKAMCGLHTFDDTVTDLLARVPADTEEALG